MAEGEWIPFWGEFFLKHDLEIMMPIWKKQLLDVKFTARTFISFYF